MRHSFSFHVLEYLNKILIMTFGITLRQANFRMELHRGHKISKWTSNLS
jgi:hypothetical protein